MMIIYSDDVKMIKGKSKKKKKKKRVNKRVLKISKVWHRKKHSIVKAPNRLVESSVECS